MSDLCLEIETPLNYTQNGGRVTFREVREVDLSAPGGYALVGQWHKPTILHDMTRSPMVTEKHHLDYRGQNPIVGMVTDLPSHTRLAWIMRASQPGPNDPIIMQGSTRLGNQLILVYSQLGCPGILTKGGASGLHGSALTTALINNFPDGPALLADPRAENAFYMAALILASQGTPRNDKHNPAFQQGSVAVPSSPPPTHSCTALPVIGVSASASPSPSAPIPRGRSASQPPLQTQLPEEPIPQVSASDRFFLESEMYRAPVRHIGDLPQLPREFLWATQVAGVYFVKPNGRALGKKNEDIPLLFPDAVGMRADQMTDPRWAQFLVDQASRLEAVAMALRTLAVVQVQNLTTVKPHKRSKP